MTEFSDLDSLVTTLRGSGANRIGIDGINGVGKTTLAKELAKELGYRMFSLDDYLEKNKGDFVQHLEYSQLSTDIKGLYQFVIAGVCLLEALEKIKAEVESLVYIKKRQHGLWADERECEIEGNVEEFIEKEREIVKRLSRIEGSSEEPETLGLGEEIIRYHASHKPHHKANIIFWKNDC